jgi:hypothetical protein
LVPHPADTYEVERTERPELCLVCPRCGETFPSAMQMDEQTFTKIRVADMLERCRACHEASRFNKVDYHFR